MGTGHFPALTMLKEGGLPRHVEKTGRRVVSRVSDVPAKKLLQLQRLVGQTRRCAWWCLVADGLRQLTQQLHEPFCLGSALFNQAPSLERQERFPRICQQWWIKVTFFARNGCNCQLSISYTASQR